MKPRLSCLRRLPAFGLLTALSISSWASPSTHAQAVRMRPADLTSFEVTAPSKVPEMAFELRNNHLILPVSVNGSEPLDVILDTGMPATGIALYAGQGIERIGLEFDPAMRAQVGGAGGDGKRYTARIAPSESLSLPGLEISNTRVIELPALPGLGNYHDGVIGYSLFDRFVVEIDYDASVLRLHDPESYEAPEDAQSVPLTLRQNVPYAPVALEIEGGSRVETEVVVDLGASHAISLNSDAVEEIRLPPHSLETNLGYGLSGPVEGRVARIHTLELAGARLRGVVTSFPQSQHQNPRGIDSLGGNLGSDVLRRFQVVFDYANKRMLLSPNGSFGEPFTFDRSGVVLALAEELRVAGVLLDSPAEAAGIRAGDLLTHFEGQEVGVLDLLSIRQRLRGEGSVRLAFDRSGDRVDVELTLRPLI